MAPLVGGEWVQSIELLRNQAPEERLHKISMTVIDGHSNVHIRTFTTISGLSPMTIYNPRY